LASFECTLPFKVTALTDDTHGANYKANAACRHVERNVQSMRGVGMEQEGGSRGQLAVISPH